MMESLTCSAVGISETLFDGRNAVLPSFLLFWWDCQSPLEVALLPTSEYTNVADYRGNSCTPFPL